MSYINNKDIIIIYGVGEDSSSQLVRIFFQKTDESFDDDGELDQEINDSGNYKDIKTVIVLTSGLILSVYGL